MRAARTAQAFGRVLGVVSAFADTISGQWRASFDDHLPATGANFGRYQGEDFQICEPEPAFKI